ncbi:YbaY family lipoprotein [Polaromonas sp. SM01]|uniref:YbaY family lipoprotein n=1 Tax=Polaromonas sp. SM01 TaxID=3085630 RepID=UPI0029821EF8|nr:YbaY family lipoprotein [Polaromonas sp. SM01]MDW5443393.1 YbaY family lipoprotein [Polaromonas sp. SM01]
MKNLPALAAGLATALAVGLVPTLHAQPAADFVTVSGKASYLQRIAMPPEAVLTVRVEDVSRADTSARVLAETREPFGRRQVPLAYTLQVPRATIDMRMRYALRATITVGAELLFTTTRHYPVLTQGAPKQVDLLLAAVGRSVASAMPASLTPPEPAAPIAPGSALGLTLPATFAGVLPCADCAGIAHTLTLRADGLYRLRRTYLGKPDGPFAETGRWTADSQGQKLTLSSGQATQLFALQGKDALRLLDRTGQPIPSSANLALRRTAQLDPVNDFLRLRGEFCYMADAATFTDCASGLRWPVSMSADYLTLERQYHQLRSAAGAPLLVSLEGRLVEMPAMEGPPREHLVVDKFGGAQAGENCGAAAAASGQAVSPDTPTATLQNTYWKLIELDGQAVTMLPQQQREVRITLSSDGSRVTGFSGCNQVMGSWQQNDQALGFTQIAGTLMACEPPIAALETKVLEMLATTTGQRIEGQQLSLLNGTQVLARFEAVYLR